MKKLLFALVLVSSSFMMVHAQTWSNEIPKSVNAASVGSLPFTAFVPANYFYTEQIFLQSQLNLPMCRITGIAFYQIDSRTRTRQIQLALGNTSLSSLSTYTNGRVLSSGLSTVFSGNASTPYEPGWWELTFTTPFVYDGTSNLVVYMHDYTGQRLGANSSDIPKFAVSMRSSMAISNYSSSHDVDCDMNGGICKVSGQSVIRILYEPITDYGIMVDGTEVLSSNANNILPVHPYSGSVRYNANTNSLTLNNLTLNGDIDCRNYPTDLTIEVVGDCHVHGEIVTTENANTNLVGTGILYVNSVQIPNPDSADLSKSRIFSVANTTAYVNTDPSDTYRPAGIYGTGPGYKYLIVEHSDLFVKGDDYPIGTLLAPGSAYGVGLYDSHIDYPANARQGFTGIELPNGNMDIDSVAFLADPLPEDPYHIYIGETTVNSANAAYIVDDMTDSGYASYDPVTNTLTFNNMYLDSWVGLSRADSTRPMTVKLIGDNTITEFLYPQDDGDTYFTGGGSLTIGDFFNGDLNDSVTMTFDNVRVSSVYGISSATGKGNLVIEHSDVHVDGGTSNWPALGGFESITLEDCHIVYPVGATITNGTITLNGQTVADSITIERDIVGLEIATTEEFSIIPNPATEIVELQGLELNDNALLIVTDMKGNTVAAIALPAIGYNYQMNVASLSSGVYVVTIINGKTRYVSKLVKK